MNIFNKVIVVIILIFIVLLSLLAIVNEFVGLFDWSQDIVSRLFNPATDINPYISTLALLMVMTLCIFLLLLEFYRRRLKIAKVYNVESGKAMITIDTVNHQIREAVLAIEGVKGMKNSIISKNNGIILNMQVELGEKSNIPQKMDEIIKRSVDVCKNKLNINVIDTKLTITNLVPEKEKKEKAHKEVTIPPEEQLAETEETEKMPAAEEQVNDKDEPGQAENGIEEEEAEK